MLVCDWRARRDPRSGVHPGLASHRQRQKCMKIKYLSSCRSDALARIRNSDALIGHVTQQDEAQAEVIVQIIDENRTPVAEVLGLFSFRRIAAEAPV